MSGREHVTVRYGNVSKRPYIFLLLTMAVIVEVSSPNLPVVVPICYFESFTENRLGRG